MLLIKHRNSLPHWQWRIKQRITSGASCRLKSCGMFDVRKMDLNFHVKVILLHTDRCAAYMERYPLAAERRRATRYATSTTTTSPPSAHPTAIGTASGTSPPPHSRAVDHTQTSSHHFLLHHILIVSNYLNCELNIYWKLICWTI